MVQEDREIQVLKKFKHSNIIQVRRIELEEEKLYIVFEFLDMNLTQFMQLRNRDHSTNSNVFSKGSHRQLGQN